MADAVREAYKKCSRALETLPTDAERQKVIHALAMLFGMEPFGNGQPKARGRSHIAGPRSIPGGGCG